MAEEPQAPETGQPTVQAPQQEQQVPNKFEGKSSEEISKAYDEAQKLIGRQGEQLGSTKKEKEELEKQIKNLNYLAEVIEGDPELFKAVKAKIQGPEENKPEQPDDVRQTITGNVIKEFEQKFGLDKLPEEKAQAIRLAIGQKVERLSGKSINDVPLSQLAETLESGYTLATINDKEEQARRQGFIEASENRNAEFGSIPSTGVTSQTNKITPEEHAYAVKFGMTDEDYLKYK